MITGLVAITPAAGFVNSFGAIIIGVVASSLVWMSWNWLGTTRLFRRSTTRWVCSTRTAWRVWRAACSSGSSPTRTSSNTWAAAPGPDVTTAGWLYGHHPKQILIQLGAAATVIVWDAFVTFVILKVLGLFMKLRLPDDVLETGDVGVHDEEAYPDDTLVTGRRIEGLVASSKQAESVEE